ncbi:Psi-producing oxygenase A [Podosphaera aphanis]|nr:Psi-producing oxygenase A [Podosphaera aphanis]
MIPRQEKEVSFKSTTKIVTKTFASNQSICPMSRKPVKKSTTRNFLADIKKLGFKDLETLLRLLNSEVKGQQDDNKFLLENLIKLLAKWNEGSKLGDQLSNAFIGNLWNSTEHPPTTSLDTRYRYRDADGGCNNIRLPNLGRANTAYARSVKPVILQNIALPDPGVIFDSLMAREETLEPHPNKISSMLFYLATIIIHDLFRTDHKDFNISKTSSYLDLAPLYGSNQEEQNTIRTFKDGKLKPDCFSEKRVLGFPPGVGVMLIMFNRFHNYVVIQLAAINENNRFNRPAETDSEDAHRKFDNELFQTGRLITCGLYINCILKDYVRTILNLNRTDSKWNLDPRSEEGKSLFTKQVPEGVGNQVSAEFNLIYRWHSTISERDEKWIQDLYAQMFRGKTPDQVTLDELLRTLGKFEADLPSDPLQRQFSDLTRNPDGLFSDDDLVSILEASVCDIAGAFGANKVPKILRSVEILGIIQSRVWNMASLNEFRQANGLIKHTSFEDINPDPVVAEKLRTFYDHPDHVELFVGLMTEKAKPSMAPGSGLCVNFTTSYTILSDAVALVRGDRFYTVDYTAKSLTNWGFTEVQYDTSIDEGCVMRKLILRSFPHHFKGNSIYAHFPFVIPDENLKIQKSLGRADLYSWDKPIRILELNTLSYGAAQKILSDKANWKYSFLANQPGQICDLEFCLSKDAQTDSSTGHSHKHNPLSINWQPEVNDFFGRTTASLLKTYSHKVTGTNMYQVDVVREVSNLVNTYFAASIFGLPIKNEQFPDELYTAHELYQIFSVLYLSIVHSHDVNRNFELSEASRRLTCQLGEKVSENIKTMTPSGIIGRLKARIHGKTAAGLSSYGKYLIIRMLEAKLPTKDIVWNQILPTAAFVAVHGSQVFCQALDFYLGDGVQYLPDLHSCARANTPEADDKLMRYFLEGARLSATMRLHRIYLPVSENSGNFVLHDGAGSLVVPIGQTVSIDLGKACRDPNAFHDPDVVSLTRPLESYLPLGLGSSPCAGQRDLNTVAMTSMFKAIFALKGLRRAQGSGPNGNWLRGTESQGELKKVVLSTGESTFMTPEQNTFCPFPTTMKIQWDQE